MVNKVDLPRTTLPTFLNFSHFHAFKNWGLGMIWDSHSSNMEKFNVNENEQAMGLCTDTTTMQGIFEGACRWILGQVVNFKCLTWIFSLVWAKQLRFGQSFSLVAPFARLIMAVQRGVILQ
jgi:hypothetical protein